MIKLRLLAAAAMAAGGVLLAAPLAYATPAPHPVVSTCHAGWYVNPDEEALLPDQVEAGFMFDGPSLVHRALAAPVLLSAAPLNGAFTGDVLTGVAPLVKLETIGPYSTINKTGAGTYWSSKIATGPGSQASPVPTIADLALLAPYTATTTVYSFGVGYANDAGNKALVKTITYGGSTYDLKCLPASSSSSSSPAATPSSTPPSTPPASSATPTATSTAPTPSLPVPTPTGTIPTLPVVVVPAGNAGGGLPLTGVAVKLVAGTGAALVLVGAGLFAYTRRRRVEFAAE